MRHQYGISALVSQTSFRGETTGVIATCRLFSQAMLYNLLKNLVPFSQVAIKAHHRVLTPGHTLFFSRA